MGLIKASEIVTGKVRFIPLYTVQSYTGLSCGCGETFTSNDSVYEVYESKQLHCQECFDEALESRVPILARRVR